MFLQLCVIKLLFLIMTIGLLDVACIPTTLPATTTHIVSFLKQKRIKPKHNEFSEFEFDNFKGNQMTKRGASLNLLAGRLVQKMNSNNIDDHFNATAAATMSEGNSTKSKHLTDDAPNQNQNTLENSMDMSINKDAIINSTDPLTNRVKQSIPVLEPVKHLLNTVRDGAFGTMNHNSSSSAHHTSHSKHPHQLVGSDGATDQTANGEGEHHDSPAIETEEEREMVNESTGFRFLELLGTIAGMVWGFLTNIQKIFAASSGSASASSSSSSSGLRR